jgi:hypothetical protein
MKKTLTIAMLSLLASANLYADSFTTNGDGTTWTLAKLAGTENSGVTNVADTFLLANTVVIAKGDKFELTPGIVVKMAKSVSFEVEGTADFAMPAAKRVRFTRAEEGVVPGPVYFKNDESVTTIKNIDFEYTGLKNFADKGLLVDSCTFRYHAYSSANGSNAISMGTSGTEFEIRNSIFERCERSAIGGAANYSNPVVIENCQFLYNGTHNRNYPQVNLTAATQVTIRNCVVLGDRDKLRVGGIVVSNLIGAAKDAHLLVEGCFVKDCSYGISVYSDQTAIVRNNILVNNDLVANANQGGSGLNVTDANGTQNTKFTGNFVMGNFWGASIIGGKNINFGRIDVPVDSEDYNIGQNVFCNNGNDGKIYDLYNNSANTVYAQNNFWLTAASFDPAAIDTCIFDKNDDATLGEVIYRVAGQNPDPTAIPALRQVLTNMQAIYNMNGVRTDEMRRGLNIVVKDGQARKVVK